MAAHVPAMIRRLALVLLLLAGARSAAGQGRPGVEVLTAEEIAQAGLIRLADLFLLLDDWSTHSVDGYAWSASAAGLAPPGADAWAVMIDGMPVPLDALGRQQLNLLPLTLAEVDSVEVYHRPAEVNGFFAPAGLLHFHTRRPESRLGVRGGFAAGNEINDPGPYRYTDFATENVDRIGPHWSVGLWSAGTYAGGRLSFAVDEHHATDTRIEKRVRDLFAGERKPRILLSKQGLHFVTEGPAGRHHAFAGVGLLEDLWFFEPAGREVPASHNVLMGGLGGDLRPGAPTGLRYRASARLYDLEPRENAAGFDFGWRDLRADGVLEGRVGSRRAGVRLGGGVRYVQATTPQALSDDRLVLPYGYAFFDARPVRGWTQELGVHVTQVDERIGLKGLLTTTIRPHERVAVAIAAAAVREAAEERGDLWSWMYRGYAAPEAISGPIERLPYLPLSTTLSADLTLDLRPTDGVRLTLAGRYRRFLDGYLPRYTFTEDEPGYAVDTDLAVDVDGEALGASAEVSARLLPGLTGSVRYVYTRPFSSNLAFWQAWQPVPWHQGSATLRLAPLDRFSLFARLAYLGRRAWPGFAASGAPGRLGEDFLLDITAQKRFWADRIRASLTVRNLLNEPILLHPAGGIFHLTFYARITVMLDTPGGL